MSREHALAQSTVPTTETAWYIRGQPTGDFTVHFALGLCTTHLRVEQREQ